MNQITKNFANQDQVLFMNLKDAHNFGPIKKPSENHTAHVTIYIFKNSKFSPPQKNRPTNVGACTPGFRLSLMGIFTSSATTTV